jgi:hypothetical protein
MARSASVEARASFLRVLFMDVSFSKGDVQEGIS